MGDKRKEDILQSGKQKFRATVKNRMYDLIAALIIVVLFAVSLGILERRIITPEEVLDIIVESVPFLLTAILLSELYYSKGVTVGKNTERFNVTVDLYSEQVNSLTGEQIEALSDFCDEYNEQALKRMQSAELRRVSLTYEKFNEYHVNDNGDAVPPLRRTPQRVIAEQYGKEVAQHVKRAKKMRVRGIQANMLLSSNEQNDITNLGRSEKEMKRQQSLTSSIGFVFSIALMTFIVVRDIAEWGWAGIVLVLFKVIYIFCRAYTTYFKGYDNITVELVAYLSRKVDILKQFLYWFEKR